MSDLARCPYCGAILNKMPQRKTNCPVCAKAIFSRRTPDSREKKLMTEAQAQANEALWQQHSSFAEIERRVTNFASVAGLDREQALAEIRCSQNPDAAWEGMVSSCAIGARTFHQRKFACHLLADIKAKNGDPAALGLLREAALLELKLLNEKTKLLPDLKVQILPGAGENLHEVCRAMLAQPVATVEDELRNPRLPNEACPMGRGALDRGFCTCTYAPWMKDWKVRRPPTI